MLLASQVFQGQTKVIFDGAVKWRRPANKPKQQLQLHLKDIHEDKPHQIRTCIG